MAPFFQRVFLFGISFSSFLKLEYFVSFCYVHFKAFTIYFKLFDFLSSNEARRKANRVLARPSFHYSGSSCYENNTEIKKKLTGAVLSSTFKDACTGGLRCTVNSVTVFCITESLDKLKMEGGHVMNEVSKMKDQFDNIFPSL